MRKTDSLADELRKLRFDIEKCFGMEQPPKASDLINSHYLEPVQIMNFFAGKNWRNITLESLEKDYVGDGSACLSFMSPAGRNYYLPAYLLIACEQYYEGDVISQGLPGRLKTYAIMDDFYQISSLGGAKMRAVAKVLKFMHEVYGEGDAKDALDSFWGKFLC